MGKSLWQLRTGTVAEQALKFRIWTLKAFKGTLCLKVLYFAATLTGFSRLSSSLLLVFDFLVPRCPEMAVHSFRCLFCMLALFGTYRVHEG